MFNSNFRGNAEDLLNSVCSAPQSEIDKVEDPNTLLNHKELVDTVVEDLKIDKEEAERLVTQIQIEELDRICKGMLEKGFLEVSAYDDEGQPVYTPTELGKKALGQ